MEKIEKIINHKDFKVYLEKNETYEAVRIFCKHDRKHFLDVCRISYLLYLEDKELQNKLPYQREEIKEILYSAGFLHDIGRWKEYEEGIPHEIASAELAKPILEDSGFCEKEIDIILGLILSHRKKEISQLHDLSKIFCQADKMSRECFWCSVNKECNWKNEKKNRTINL